MQPPEERVAPEGKAADRVAFLLNNVTSQTVAVHAAELAGKLQPKHFHWFAQYLVQQKAANEPNHHGVYVELLVRMDSRLLYKTTLETSYEARRPLTLSFLCQLHIPLPASSRPERDGFREPLRLATGAALATKAQS
jgi:CCR4-NOT transcription complex subunit 1 CAF1-binding domain